MSTGIQVRHTRACAKEPCTCKPSYRAEVYDARSGKKIRRTFRNFSEAKSWRTDAASQVNKGTMTAPTRVTLQEAGEALIEGVKAGTIRTRKGLVYKPSAIRSYELALSRVYPELGRFHLSEISRNMLQDFADRLLADGLDPSTIQGTLMPVRVIYKRAVKRGEVAVNPTSLLDLPASTGTRDRIAAPAEAAQLIAAVPVEHRALWATAFYAGLRRGELMALEWSSIDLEKNIIHVERAYDDKAKEFIATKNRETRKVPIASVLREHLISHKLRCGWSEGLVFGRSSELPLPGTSVWRRARTAWKNTELAPISLHECRHTFASLMIAAGVNVKALSAYMGHSSITITLDRYGHLMPGNEEEAAGLLDAYLVGQLRASEGQ
jgi:integrase